jgi:dipeptidase D
LAVVKTAYQDRLGREPVLATVHASVECGTLRERLPGLDILSFGPEIHNAHRVGECVQISSVAEFYRLLCEVVRRLAT